MSATVSFPTTALRDYLLSETEVAGAYLRLDDPVGAPPVQFIDHAILYLDRSLRRLGSGHRAELDVIGTGKIARGQIVLDDGATSSVVGLAWTSKQLRVSGRSPLALFTIDARRRVMALLISAVVERLGIG